MGNDNRDLAVYYYGLEKAEWKQERDILLAENLALRQHIAGLELKLSAYRRAVAHRQGRPAGTP